MDVPSISTTSTTTILTESERRTNALLVELDRPPISVIVVSVGYDEFFA